AASIRSRASAQAGGEASVCKCQVINGGLVMQPDNTTSQPWQTQGSAMQSIGQSGAMVRRLAMFLGLAAFGAACAAIAIYASPGQATQHATTSTVTGALPDPDSAPTPEVPSQKWIAAAPGRVEPRSGQIRIGTGIPG